MPISREKVIEQLEALGIAYVDEMSYSELTALLGDAKPEKAAAKEKALDIPVVKVGVTTINDHEQRITALERKLNV